MGWDFFLFSRVHMTHHSHKALFSLIWIKINSGDFPQITRSTLAGPVKGGQKAVQQTVQSLDCTSLSIFGLTWMKTTLGNLL